jgi:hypothetical protein
VLSPLARHGESNASALGVSSSRLTAPAATSRVLPMTAEVDTYMDEYIRRYSERDVEGVTELCLWPFLAI